MYNRQKGFEPQKKISDKYRLWLWKKADSLITYSNSDRELLIKHNIPTSKIFIAYNTIDTNKYLKIRDDFERIGISECKRKLNFTHNFNLVFIGRLLKEKKPELLLDVLKELKNKGINSVAIHFVGEGEMLPILKAQSSLINHSSDVFFHGAIYDDIITGEILFSSDLMIMPGYVGLSVNHSFCFNCPVVTFAGTNSNFAHSPEIEYLINNKTGFVIEDDSIESLVNSIEVYLTSPEIQHKMKREIKYMIENVCSIEKMSEGIINAIEHNMN
jgi:glycosyltransferase involved in cell wall biosynthesis